MLAFLVIRALALVPSSGSWNIKVVEYMALSGVFQFGSALFGFLRQTAKGKGKRGWKSTAPGAEEATAGKGDLGRKRKDPEPEAGRSESRRTKVARMSEASGPARAPVARMR